MPKKKRGFTLVELLVVIAIIGILSSVVVASLNTARLKARDARRISDIKQIELALEMYYDANNKYPPAANIANLSPYLSTIPTDPSNNSSYLYAGLGSGATCTGYHLGVTLEDVNNIVLQSDKDATAGTACTTSSADWNGDDPIYDIKP